MRPLVDIERRLDQLTGNWEMGTFSNFESKLENVPAELLELGEEVLEHWVAAKGLEPTQELREGFRLLALHAQGTKGDPSFNACRETCRELVYHYNLLTMDPQHEESPRRLRMMALVANHLRLFVVGKLQVAGLGDFCCSSRPAREQAARVEPA
ncbi:MAG TPA: hypothetical protein PL152_10605 [Steroidobacteraceae bacterium]|nr:hypothetical protein [Steroidobacteraceae bacterium]